MDFPPPAELLPLIGQTLAIVVLGTVLSVLLSVPLALLAAYNTTPHPVVRAAARFVIVAGRALPELILAMLFLRLFGLGAPAGILAIGLHSVGMVGKLLADSIEELDSGPREAVRAVGAGSLQQIAAAVLPALKPALIATTLHRFDINLRGSVILGFVGVAGIGLEISSALNTLNYRRGLALALVLLIMCVLNELVSASIRSAVLGRQRQRRHSVRSLILGRLLLRTDTPRSPSARPDRRLSEPWNGERVGRTVWLGITALIIITSVYGAQIDPGTVSRGLRQAGHTLSLYVPPATGGIADKLLIALGETVQMALAGTMIGLLVAVPVGIFAASNVAPRRWIATSCRLLIVGVRAIPDLIVAIFFVVITGLGAVAGSMALAFGTVGFLSKIIADSLEETDVAVQQALRASGADRPQVFFAVTSRQAAPMIVSHLMHQLDNNIRAATSLGVIGAGGIGYYMINANRVLQFDVVTSCVLMILVVVIIAELVALWIRRAVR